MENQVTPVDNGKTTAIVSYLTIIGWLIAYFAMYPSNKTTLAGYHLRQSLLLMLCGIAFQILRILIFSYSTMMSLLFGVLGLGFFVLWLLGFIAALNGQEKPIPLIGEKAQDIFKGI